MKSIILVLSLFPLACPLWAESPSHPSSEEALRRTQNLLRDSKQRNAYIEESKSAQQANEYLKTLTDDNLQSSDEIYDLAAEAFEVITENAQNKNGEVDVEKMKALMQKYQENPEGFYRQLTPEQKLRIKKLSEKIGPSPASIK